MVDGMFAKIVEGEVEPPREGDLRLACDRTEDGT
jgi:hypothetical protein